MTHHVANVACNRLYALTFQTFMSEISVLLLYVITIPSTAFGCAFTFSVAFFGEKVWKKIIIYIIDVCHFCV